VEQAADQPALPMSAVPARSGCVHELRRRVPPVLPDLLPIHPQPLGEARLERIGCPFGSSVIRWRSRCSGAARPRPRIAPPGARQAATPPGVETRHESEEERPLGQTIRRSLPRSHFEKRGPPLRVPWRNLPRAPLRVTRGGRSGRSAVAERASTASAKAAAARPGSGRAASPPHSHGESPRLAGAACPGAGRSYTRTRSSCS